MSLISVSFHWLVLALFSAVWKSLLHCLQKAKSFSWNIDLSVLKSFYVLELHKQFLV